MNDSSGKSGVIGGVLRGETPRAWPWIVMVVLCGLVTVAFWPAFSADYVSWDDQHNFIDNTMWQGLSSENLRWMMTSFHVGHYTPLTWLSFGLQYELFGGGPGPGHAINIAVHAANVVLFFFVTRWFIGTVAAGWAGREVDIGAVSKLVTLASAVGAAFFGVHPLRVESVAWITERRDVLSAAFLLGAVLAYVRAVRAGGVRLKSWQWYVGAIVLTLLSCAAKAWGISFFVVLMALDMYPLRRVGSLRAWFTRDGLRVAAQKLPFAVIGLVTAVLASKAQAAANATKRLDEWGVMERVVQAFYGLTFYLKQTVAPSTHSPFYELPVEVRPGDLEYVTAYAVVAAMIVAAVWCWRRAPGVTVGLFIYLVQLSPVLGVLQSGQQFVADRYSYLATMPFAVGLGWVLVWAVQRAELSGGAEGGRRAARVGGVVSVGVVGALMAASAAQTTIWRDSRTMWAYAAEVTPTSTVLDHYALMFEKDDPERALELYAQAVRTNPRDGRGWYSYGNLVWAKGNLAEAERAFLTAAECMQQAYMARQNLASMYLKQGWEDQAVAQLELAIADIEDPRQRIRDGLPYLQLAEIMESRGRVPEAVELARKAMAYSKTRELAATKLRELGALP